MLSYLLVRFTTQSAYPNKYPAMSTSHIEPKAVIANNFPKVVIPLIREAKHSIKVIVFDWRWYPSVGGSSIAAFNAEISAAARRGVSVRALVNNDQVIERLRGVRCQARRLISKRLLHTKMLIVDDTKVVIGSHNYTQNGFATNFEASVLVHMSSEQNEFVEYFERMWGL